MLIGEIVEILVSKTPTSVVTKTPRGMTVTVKLRVHHPFGVGHKGTAMAQKGTFSANWRAMDLPYTDEGISPDIIIDPCGIPSRQTGGLLHAMRDGLLLSSDPGALDDERFPWASRTMNSIQSGDLYAKWLDAQLPRLGFQSQGYTRFRCPYTGKRLKGQIFVGIVPMLTMTQQPEGKMHVKPKHGPTLVTTGQPLKGRRLGGGIRFGEQENGQVTNQGCAFQLGEWLLRSSDQLNVDKCNVCGRFAKTVHSAGHVVSRSCNWCQDGTIIGDMIPGSLKNLICAAQTAGISIRLFSDPNRNPDEIERYIRELQKALVTAQAGDVFDEP